MADLKLTCNFVPETGSVDKLVSSVQGAFGKEVTVKFKADTSGLSSVNDLLKNSAIQTTGLSGAKRQLSLETAHAIAQSKVEGQQYDATAKRFRSETAEINRNNAAKRTSNMEQKAAEQAARKSAAADRKAIQNSLDFKYLKRQSEDYFNTYQRGILKNKELTAAWADYNKQQFKDPIEQRQALQDMMARTREAGAEVETLGMRIKRLFGQHFDTALVMVGINALRQALQQVYQNVVQLDKAVVNLQIATGGSRSEMQSLLSDYSKLGQEVGATTLEVADSADSWLRQGKTAEETNILIRDSLMLSKLGAIDSAEATKALTSAMKGYKVEAKDATGIIDKLTAVDLVSATSSGSLATSMSETAVSANIAGVSMDKLIGQIATVSEVTQD